MTMLGKKEFLALVCFISNLEILFFLFCVCAKIIWVHKAKVKIPPFKGIGEHVKEECLHFVLVFFTRFFCDGSESVMLVFGPFKHFKIY